MFEETDVVRFKRHFQTAFRRVASLVGDPARTGVYAAIANKLGIVIVSFVVGEPNIEKAPKYFHCAGEKCFRLGQHPDHLTSAESANEKMEQYPGAWRTAGYVQPNSLIVSVSGLPTGDADTAVGLYAMAEMKEIPVSWADYIASLKGMNIFYNKLKEGAATT